MLYYADICTLKMTYYSTCSNNELVCLTIKLISTLNYLNEPISRIRVLIWCYRLVSSLRQYVAIYNEERQIVKAFTSSDHLVHYNLFYSFAKYFFIPDIENRKIIDFSISLTYPVNCWKKEELFFHFINGTQMCQEVYLEMYAQCVSKVLNCSMVVQSLIFSIDNIMYTYSYSNSFHSSHSCHWSCQYGTVAQ